jgi:hypothetical protein
MRTSRVRPPRGTRGLRRRRAAGLAGFAFVSMFVVLAFPGAAQAATTGVGDLTAPESRTPAMIDFDPFRTFTNCLAEAAHGDSMYPGIDPSEVNACLGL